MTHPLHVAALTSLHTAAPTRTEAAEDAWFRSHAADLPAGVARTLSALRTGVACLRLWIRPGFRAAAAVRR